MKSGFGITEGHYKVTIRVSKTNESVDHGGEVGVFALRVIGENGKMSERLQFSEHSRYYGPGSAHTIVLAGDVVGEPEAVELTWEYQTSFFNPLTWRLLHKPCVYINSVTVESLEYGQGYAQMMKNNHNMFFLNTKKLTFFNT